jgi:hypothetical protein
MVKKISSAQIRAARALLRWSALDLASASKVGVATIRRAEVVEGEIPVTLANEAALRRACGSRPVRPRLSHRDCPQSRGRAQGAAMAEEALTLHVDGLGEDAPTPVRCTAMPLV